MPGMYFVLTGVYDTSMYHSPRETLTYVYMAPVVYTYMYFYISLVPGMPALLWYIWYRYAIRCKSASGTTKHHIIMDIWTGEARGQGLPSFSVTPNLCDGNGI